MDAESPGQLAAFEANPSLDLVFGHMQNFISPELSAEEPETNTGFLGKQGRGLKVIYESTSFVGWPR